MRSIIQGRPLPLPQLRVSIKGLQPGVRAGEGGGGWGGGVHYGSGGCNVQMARCSPPGPLPLPNNPSIHPGTSTGAEGAGGGPGGARSPPAGHTRPAKQKGGRGEGAELAAFGRTPHPGQHRHRRSEFGRTNRGPPRRRRRKRKRSYIQGFMGQEVGSPPPTPCSSLQIAERL